MMSELKSYKSPLLNTTVTICVAANNKDLLEKKSNIIKSAYRDMNFGIERPLSDQTKLYMQFIPSVGIMVKDFIMPLTPTTLASGIIGATHALGDNRGPYIGTTGEEEKTVYLDMGEAALKNKSPAATFFGNLGVGKSFNANLLTVLSVIYGGYGLIIDPKGERSHWMTELKALKGLISIVTLGSSDDDRGKLDPYNVYRGNIAEANELAISVLLELFEISTTSDAYTALQEAVTRIEEGDTKPSMLKLASILDDFPEDDALKIEASKIARKIRAQKNGMSKLIIGNGNEKSITLDNRLNIIQIQNLKMPQRETHKTEYTNDERLSVIAMMVLSQFAKQFALTPRTVLKTILFDEFWMLGKTSEGVKLYEFLSRMGRSLYTCIIFNGHSVTDIPTEGIRNTITYKFCFQATDTNEAVRMLEYLKLEDNQRNREMLMNLGNGECFFSDLNEHVGKLRFDAVFQDLIDVFSTTPKTEEVEELQHEEVEELQHEEVEELQHEEVEALHTDKLSEIAEDNINIYEREAM